MAIISWLKQTSDKPAFPDLLWSRTENRRHAGKLLVVGGGIHGFNEVSAAFAASQTAGIGSARIFLPDSLQKTVGKVFPEAEFGPSTPSGSFSRTALAPVLDASAWADGVLLAGSFGRNSETAILLESFASRYNGLLTHSGDSIEYFYNAQELVLERPNTLVVATISQLQKLLTGRVLIRHSMELMQLVNALSGLDLAASLLTEHNGHFVAYANKTISTTPAGGSLSDAAAYASVWQLQQPNSPFEALTTAAYCLLGESK